MASIKLRVDKSLKEVLEDVRKKTAYEIKRKYGLKEITVHGTLASQILAAKMRGHRTLNFKIRKVSLTKGVLELM